MRVAAYITGYEDLEALQRCVSAIRSQTHMVEKIFIIENSRISYQKEFQGEDIVFKHHPENIGISEGLGIFIQWGTNQKFDFLWTFDQDSEPSENCLKILLRHYTLLSQRGYKVGLLLPRVIDSITKENLNGAIFNGYRFLELNDQETNGDYYECDAVITSGSLVSIQAANETELPHKDLFIDAVDWDYCMKLRRKNYFIFVIKEATLVHRFGQAITVKSIIRKREINIHSYSPLRYYYMTRNHTYVETRLSQHHKMLLRSIIHRLQCLIYLTVKVIFYDRQNMTSKLSACYKGTLHGLIGKFDRYDLA
jgi:rhamnosyltransferase